MTIVFFVFNQTWWVVDQHDELVGSVSSVAWLLYDYLNLLFHLTAELFCITTWNAISIKNVNIPATA